MAQHAKKNSGDPKAKAGKRTEKSKALSNSKLAKLSAQHRSPSVSELEFLEAALGVASERSPLLGMIAEDLRARAAKITAKMSEGSRAIGKSIHKKGMRKSMGEAALRIAKGSGEHADEAVAAMLEAACRPKGGKYPWGDPRVAGSLCELAKALDGARAMGPKSIATLEKAFHGDSWLVGNAPRELVKDLAKMTCLDLFSDPSKALGLRLSALCQLHSNLEHLLSDASEHLLDALERDGMPIPSNLDACGAHSKGTSPWSGLLGDRLDHMEPATAGRLSKAIHGSGAVVPREFIERCVGRCGSRSTQRDKAVEALASIPGIFEWRGADGRSLSAMLNDSIREHGRAGNEECEERYSKAFSALVRRGMDPLDLLPKASVEALAGSAAVRSAIERVGMLALIHERDSRDESACPDPIRARTRL